MNKEDKFAEIVSAIDKEFDSFIFLVEDMGTVKGDWMALSKLLIQMCFEYENFKSLLESVSDFVKSEKFEELLERKRMESNKYND